MIIRSVRRWYRSWQASRIRATAWRRYCRDGDYRALIAGERAATAALTGLTLVVQHD